MRKILSVGNCFYLHLKDRFQSKDLQIERGLQVKAFAKKFFLCLVIKAFQCTCTFEKELPQ